MTLILSDIKAVWAGEAKERDIPFASSSFKVNVMNALGESVSGELNVNGTSFPIADGCCKVLTERLTKYGSNPVYAVSSHGVRLRCSDIDVTGTGWRLPSPSEAMRDEEIVALLARCEELKSTVSELKKKTISPVSEILGI